jgi:hypothetical protein
VWRHQHEVTIGSQHHQVMANAQLRQQGVDGSGRYASKSA